jgi:hypothetical protein
METNDINFPPDQPTDMVISADAKYFLHTAGKWANFLSILGFICTGFIVLVAFFVGSIMTLMTRFNPAASSENVMATSGVSGIITFVYLGVGVIYFFVSYYLNRFAAYIKRGTIYNSAVDASKAFKFLKSHFKLIGIVSIVGIALYILLIIVVFIAAASGAFGSHATNTY